MSNEECFDSLRFRQRQLTVKLVLFINIMILEDQPFSTLYITYNNKYEKLDATQHSPSQKEEG